MKTGDLVQFIGTDGRGFDHLREMRGVNIPELGSYYYVLKSSKRGDGEVFIHLVEIQNPQYIDPRTGKLMEVGFNSKCFEKVGLTFEQAINIITYGFQDL